MEIEADELLSEHLEGLKSVLADSLVAVYLHGSLAHGGFGDHSDVDFLVVVSEEPKGERLQATRHCSW